LSPEMVVLNSSADSSILTILNGVCGCVVEGGCATRGAVCADLGTRAARDPRLADVTHVRLSVRFS